MYMTGMARNWDWDIAKFDTVYGHVNGQNALIQRKANSLEELPLSSYARAL